MNGALVIPKLMCIKFSCWKDRQFARIEHKKTSRKAGYPVIDNAILPGALPQRFKRFDTLQVRRNIFEFVSLFLIPHNFIIRVKRLR